MLSLLFILAGSALNNWPCSSKYIDLVPKVFCIAMINYALLHGY